MDAMGSRLPGLQPVAEGDWLRVDDAYAPQMAYRDHLLSHCRDDVYRCAGGSARSEALLLDCVVQAVLALPGFSRTRYGVRRPDGQIIDPEREDSPAIAAARLAQEDFIILTRSGAGHVVTTGVVCFPASWTLSEKMGRTLTAVHGPVARYDAGMGLRVERILTLLPASQAVWRANVLCYNDPDLHQPRGEHERRPFDPDGPVFVRVERQTLRRLSADAVVFSIHTYLTPLANLSAEQRASLPAGVRSGGSMGEIN
jgi:hypothetical protein